MQVSAAVPLILPGASAAPVCQQVTLQAGCSKTVQLCLLARALAGRVRLAVDPWSGTHFAPDKPGVSPAEWPWDEALQRQHNSGLPCKGLASAAVYPADAPQLLGFCETWQEPAYHSTM